MIGRTEPVDHFDLVRWARRMASACDLAPTEAHVLLILATYADANAEAWPTLKTLAFACGRTPSADGTCSTISRALSTLQARELVWTKQGGKGRSAKRELLFDPAYPMRPAPGWEVDQPPLPSHMQEGNDERYGDEAIAPVGNLPSHGWSTEEPGKTVQEPIKKNQESLPTGGKACHPGHGKVSESVIAEDRRRVRLQIVQSLESAA